MNLLFTDVINTQFQNVAQIRKSGFCFGGKLHRIYGGYTLVFEKFDTGQAFFSAVIKREEIFIIWYS